MKTGIENAKATLEIYEKLEKGEKISIEEVKTCWSFIADVYSGMEKQVEKILSLLRYGDRNIFKKILYIEVKKYDNLVYVGYETVKGNETELSFERKFLGMNIVRSQCRKWLFLLLLTLKERRLSLQHIRDHLKTLIKE